jgi:hypothetical protein
MKKHTTRLLRARTESKERVGIESENQEGDPGQESLPVEQQNSSPNHQIPPKSESLACPNKKCGKPIIEPLRMVDLSNGSKEKVLYVCPYCMSRLEAVTGQESSPKSSAKKPVAAVEKPNEAAETGQSGPQGCPHFLGYLKGRPRDTPIPDECLACPEAVKCMLG